MGDELSLGKMHMAQEDRAIICVMHLSSECGGRAPYLPLKTRGRNDVQSDGSQAYGR